MTMSTPILRDFSVVGNITILNSNLAGTDAPILTIALAPSKEFSIDFNIIGEYFSTGIGYGLTTGAPDADTGALTAGDIVGMNVWTA